LRDRHIKRIAKLLNTDTDVLNCKWTDLSNPES
jgi:dynein heavy chain